MSAAFFTANSQIITVCGTDTVILQLENYLNGSINWQESYDTIAWEKIPNETNLSFKFVPVEEKYYRAVVKTSECEPLYSPISFIQLPPKANAGTDRLVGIETIKLLGSDTLGGIGEWTFLSGTGTIHEPQNPISEFTFTIDTAVNLIWTVTNACGESSDTVHLTYDPLVPVSNYIIVDNTDLIYSDSIEMANGNYKIKFSDPEISPTDSVILIAMRDDISFLRHVISYTYQDSIYNFTTDQCTLEEVFSSGTFNMGESVNESMINKEGSQMKSNKGFPTRESIRQLKNQNELNILYIETKFDDRYPGLSYKTYSEKGDPFVINLPDIPIFQNSVLYLGINESFVSLDPNFVVDMTFKWFKLKKIKIGVDNAEFKYGYTTGLYINGAFSFERDTSIFNVSKRIWFAIGGFPVMVETNFDIVASFEAKGSADMTFEREVLNTRNFTALVTGKPGDLKLTTLSSNKKKEDFNIDINGNLSSVVKIGPQVSFMVYGAVGPYIDVPIKAEADLCASGDPLDEFYWQAHAGLGIEGNIGARGKFFGKTLFDFNFNIFDCSLGPQIDIPYELELISGYNQTGFVNENLDDPIIIKVKSSLGFAVPLVQVNVYLEDNNGTTSKTSYWSDINGLVSIDWQLGSNPVNTMKIFTKDCNFQNLESSPLYVYAYSEEPPFDCLNSDLQISMVQINDSYITEVTGGEKPYKYSLDGISFNTDIPVFSIFTPGEFTVFVKDAHDCQFVHSFVIEDYDPCKESELAVFVYTEANTAELSASEGVPPYQYALNDPHVFMETSWYGFLNPGVHLAYVQDAMGCIDSVIFEIPQDAIDPLIAIHPEQNQLYVPVDNISFEWEAGNYAPDQSYDLYLKEDGQSYTMIASNLTDEAYINSGTLNYEVLYYWSVVVKDQEGNPKDTAEFSFTTEQESPDIPQPAELQSPADSAVIVSNSVNLQWVDQAGDFLYNLYLDNDYANQCIALNLENSEYLITDLENEQYYSWKVVTKSLETGVTAESETFTFRIDTTPPEPAVLLSPTNNAIIASTSVNLQWVDQTEDIVYDLYLDNNSANQSIAVNLENSEYLVTDLENGLHYFWKVVTKSLETGLTTESEIFTFLIDTTTSVTDIDGNVYQTVIIGNQIWMKENLRVKHFNDGTPIDNVTDFGEWVATLSPAYSWYNNDSVSYDADYGPLYNWYVTDTLSNGSRNVCPDGWHIPDTADFNRLVNYLGGTAIAGGKLKEAGLDHWASPNTGATNESGFTGLPGGGKDQELDPWFTPIYETGNWWTSDKASDSSSWFFRLNYDSDSTSGGFCTKFVGYSLRCLKDD